VDVPEPDAVSVVEGMPARVCVHALKHQIIEGKVTRSSWSLDPKSRTLRVEIDLPNPQGQLRPAMYAYVTLLPETQPGKPGKPD
jgi:multidrug efflux pump subunit AcrA (membrane-fusion protein)